MSLCRIVKNNGSVPREEDNMRPFYLKKSRLILCLVLAMLSCCRVYAAGKKGDFGIGFIIGEPTGLSFKWWTQKNRAVDAALGFSTNDVSFHIHADYLFHTVNRFQPRKEKLPFYYGIGFRFKEFKTTARRTTGSETHFGLRFPLGLDFFVQQTPLEVFIEAVPILDLTPGTDFQLKAAGGIRYYF